MKLSPNIRRYSSFNHPNSTDRMKQAAEAAGVGLGGLLEMLVLGMSDDDIKAAVTRGRIARKEYPDGRTGRKVLARQLQSLSPDKLELIRQIIDNENPAS
jgi:hypothetical protein